LPPPIAATLEETAGGAGLVARTLALPVTDGLDMSLAVMVCVPVVLRVTPFLKVCTPLSKAVKVYLPGKEANWSELVKLTVPR